MVVRSFACPVCHLALSTKDLDGDNYAVCPVCGVVVEVVSSNGHLLPVVHGMEWKRSQVRFRLHSLSTHASVGLLPVALLFALVAPFLEWFDFGTALYFERTAYLLLLLTIVSATFSFVTGFSDWRLRYRSRPYEQIQTKIRFTFLLMLLGAAAMVVRSSGSAVQTLSVRHLLFCVLLAAMVGVIAVLGHIGGRLVFGK